MRSLVALLSLVLAPALAASPTADVVFCAEGQAPEYSSELMARIEDARAINQPGAVIEIRITGGTFTKLSSMPGAFELVRPCAANEVCFGNKTLRFRGGYSDQTNCEQRNTRFFETTLYPDAFGLRAGGDFNLEFESIGVQLQGPVDIDVRRCPGCTGQRHVHFSDGVIVGVNDFLIHAGAVEFTNNWVISAPIAIGTPAHSPHSISVGFNTFFDMTEIGLRVVSRSGRAHIHHNVAENRLNILFPSMFFDVVPGSEPLLQYNALRSFVVAHGTTQLQPSSGSQANLITNNIGFAASTKINLNPHLREAPPSLAINAGMTPAELLAAGIDPPEGTVALASNPRLVGSRYDLGAYESSTLFRDGFQ
jgi:acetyltransferase-like isoleucine patch superfamily enzyme